MDDEAEKRGRLQAESEAHGRQLDRLARKLEEVEARNGAHIERLSDRLAVLELNRERISATVRAIGMLGGLIAGLLTFGKFLWDWIASLPLFRP